MRQKLLTDAQLRFRWPRERGTIWEVEEGTILTPSAKDFLREHGITLQFTRAGQTPKAMTRVPIPVRNGRAVYVDAATGEELAEKGETMTHLRGNLLVPKTHPRIEFRGRLDSLMAGILEVQVTAEEAGEQTIAEDLEELLGAAREILAAEVKEQPLPQMRLLGMDSGGIRHCSHHVKKTLGIDHPVPRRDMGRLCVELNRLRTQARETELPAARAFSNGTSFCRTDIIEGLNRMSSCIYIIFCRKLAGYYDREEQR